MLSILGVTKGTAHDTASMLREAALGANDVRSRLSQAVRDNASGSGYAYYVDHQGDDQSGDCIYECSDGTMSVPYDFDNDNGSAPVLHMDSAKRVMQRTQYDDVPDDDDAYTSQMEEAFVKTKLYTTIPLYERFISQGERDKADASDFAGKGKSFPILKAGDVMAAVRSMGRAGSSNYSSDQLKKNIIRIAKRKGFASSLPKSWQGNGSKESGKSRVNVSRETQLCLVESAQTVEVIRLVEAKADYEIKLIAPGKGSTAFYPAEVLRRDGPKVFTAGTHVYLNHPTAAEEAARPEGDVANLAGVLTADATYHESHAKGPGLFARMKVFADHAQMVEEKAAHVGMSIRAFGQQESGKTKDGVPVLKELTSAESVDVVTRAGAGGMILTEAARAAENHLEGDSMTDAEAKELRESNQRLLARALRSDAREQGQRILEGVSLPPASKLRVVDNVIERGIPQKDGEIDLAKFTEAINAEAKREGQYVASLPGFGGRVTGMGSSGETDPAKLREAEQRRENETKQYRETATDVFAELMQSEDAGAHAASFGDWKVKPIDGGKAA